MTVNRRPQPRAAPPVLGWKQYALRPLGPHFLKQPRRPISLSLELVIAHEEQLLPADTIDLGPQLGGSPVAESSPPCAGPSSRTTALAQLSRMSIDWSPSLATLSSIWAIEPRKAFSSARTSSSERMRGARCSTVCLFGTPGPRPPVFLRPGLKRVLSFGHGLPIPGSGRGYWRVTLSHTPETGSDPSPPGQGATTWPLHTQ
jgi:hypothetical protein